MPPKGHPSNVFKKLYKRLKNILEYNSLFTCICENFSSFFKDVTVIHIVTKVRPFESYEQSLLFKFEDLQKSQFLYKDAFEYHQARNLQNEQTLLFHAFRLQML